MDSPGPELRTSWEPGGTDKVVLGHSCGHGQSQALTVNLCSRGSGVWLQPLECFRSLPGWIGDLCWFHWVTVTSGSLDHEGASRYLVYQGPSDFPYWPCTTYSSASSIAHFWPP